MRYTPAVITQPILEPISLADIKEHLRITHSDEDDLLTAYATAARQYVEQRTGRTLMQTTWEWVADRFPGASNCGLVLPMAAPLLSVTNVKYTDSDAVITTWPAANYIVNIDAMPGHVIPAYGSTWPSYTPYPSGSVRIRYVAGLSTAASPLIYPAENLLNAIRLLTGGFYENRESEVVNKGSIAKIAVDYGVENILSQYKVSYAF